MPVPSAIRALEIVDPAKARQKIIQAVKAAGSIPAAAKSLGLQHHKALYRIIARMGLRDELKKSGIPVGGGYPPERIAGLRNVVRNVAQRHTLDGAARYTPSKARRA